MVMIITYMTFFILQIVLFVLSIRGKTKKLWMSLFGVECISILIALGLCVYYNIHQGPNFSNFFYTLFSFGAVLVFGLFLLISVLVMRKE